ncbi:MAG: hypothetical protein AAFX87_11770 [Bacteroidota bacterium]
MEEEHNPEASQDRIEIPHTFYSHNTKEPFTHCIECDKYLLEDGVHYGVEKVIRKYPLNNTTDVIFEYAICLDCMLRMQSEFSEESSRKLQEYMMRHMDIKAMKKKLIEGEGKDVDTWLARCAITDELIEDQEEYTIHAHFEGNKMLTTVPPHAFGARALEEMTDLLSAETLGFYDDFMGRHFSGPPEIEEILKGRKPVLF